GEAAGDAAADPGGGVAEDDVAGGESVPEAGVGEAVDAAGGAEFGQVELVCAEQVDDDLGGAQEGGGAGGAGWGGEGGGEGCDAAGGQWGRTRCCGHAGLQSSDPGPAVTRARASR